MGKMSGNLKSATKSLHPVKQIPNQSMIKVCTELASSATVTCSCSECFAN